MPDSLPCNIQGTVLLLPRSKVWLPHPVDLDRIHPSTDRCLSAAMYTCVHIGPFCIHFFCGRDPPKFSVLSRSCALPSSRTSLASNSLHRSCLSLLRPRLPSQFPCIQPDLAQATRREQRRAGRCRAGTGGRAGALQEGARGEQDPEGEGGKGQPINHGICFECTGYPLQSPGPFGVEFPWC